MNGPGPPPGRSTRRRPPSCCSPGSTAGDRPRPLTTEPACARHHPTRPTADPDALERDRPTRREPGERPGDRCRDRRRRADRLPAARARRMLRRAAPVVGHHRGRAGRWSGPRRLVGHPPGQPARRTRSAGHGLDPGRFERQPDRHRSWPPTAWSPTPTVFRYYVKLTRRRPVQGRRLRRPARARGHERRGQAARQGRRCPPATRTVVIPEGLWLSEIRARILQTFPEMKPADLDHALATVHSKYQPAGSHQPRRVPVPGHLPGAAHRRGPTPRS